LERAEREKIKENIPPQNHIKTKRSRNALNVENADIIPMNVAANPNSDFTTLRLTPQSNFVILQNISLPPKPVTPPVSQDKKTSTPRTPKKNALGIRRPRRRPKKAGDKAVKRRSARLARDQL
jgi:hypothetical protein